LEGDSEVEFKYDQRDGCYKILDVNTRSWTWCALGAVAGVDFSHILWRLALGERGAPIRPDREAAWVHIARDVVAASQEMLRGRLSVAAYLGSFRRPMGFAAFAPDDLLPGIAEL